MKFGYTILYVADVSKSLAFYDAAFGFKTKFAHDSGEFGELDTGATSLAFCSQQLMTLLQKNPQTASPQAPCFEIAFTTDDVPTALQRAVAAGATLIEEPKLMPWGQTIAYVSDLDGFLVEICTPVGT